MWLRVISYVVISSFKAHENYLEFLIDHHQPQCPSTKHTRRVLEELHLLHDEPNGLFFRHYQPTTTKRRISLRLFGRARSGSGKRFKVPTIWANERRASKMCRRTMHHHMHHDVRIPIALDVGGGHSAPPRLLLGIGQCGRRFSEGISQNSPEEYKKTAKITNDMDGYGEHGILLRAERWDVWYLLAM
ncbi:hypothetical protein PG989_007776 [Apiospora arundinis]